MAPLTYPPGVPQQQHHGQSTSQPTVSGLGRALQPGQKRPRIEESPPSVFHRLLDAHGLLLSVGAGARCWGTSRSRCWCPMAGCGPATCARVRIVGVASGALPPPVAPARLMYEVRATGAGQQQPQPQPQPQGDMFLRLDPAAGGSWQYELQQLRFANKRLEEEIAVLERAERVREAERERQERQERYEAQQAEMRGEAQAQAQWGYPTPVAYQLPLKRGWDMRDDA
ncbi:hypothetical protein B0H15DRAFT_801502 [Mycena belliarum]|uniref:Uncharacterized protein n=1 Tax=Mycena belliarum TaxID=1033014 RepID=A0AAD6U206_9AGAR|nr:hypothetical protein B0H15DRAFT_801502 [Mycena belliae]